MVNMENINKHLILSSFKKLSFWDYYTLSSKSEIFSNYDLVELSEVIIQRKHTIIIDDNKDYKRCRVQTKAKGVVLRDKVFGKEIKTKRQQLCKKDDFLVAEIDAKVGGYGIVPDYLKGAIVSGHYFLFEIDKTKLLPEFLSILVKCKDFSKQIKATGSTNYAAIRPFHVLGYLIPLPSISEQKKIVDAYNSKIEVAQEMEAEAKELEKGIGEYLFEKLGIKLRKKVKKQGMHLINSLETKRWDVMYLLGKVSGLQSFYSIKSFKDIIIDFNKNRADSIRINTSDFPDSIFKYIGMENIEKQTGKLIEDKEVDGKEIKSQTLRVPEGFFLFGKLRPYLNKYWLNNTNHNNIICSSEFFVFNIKENIDKDFFISCLSSNFVQHQISDKTSGARMPRINEEIFMNLKMPFPPEDIQQEIAEKLINLKLEIERLKKKSYEKRTTAIENFEKEVFES